MLKLSKNDSRINRITKTAFSLLLQLICCALAGVVLMCAVYSIPSERIENNVATAARIFYEEGSYPEIRGIHNSVRDNCSDAVMLLQAVYTEEGNALNAAMLNYRSTIDSGAYVEETQIFTQHYLDNEAFNGKVMYGRYWNGYLLFLKPALAVLTYAQIRLVNIVLQTALFAAVILLFCKKNLKHLILSYTVSMLMISPFTIALNLQQTHCFTILNLGVAFILLFKDKISSKGVIVFFYLGVATAFFDLLSYPLATFGVPAVIFFCVVNTADLKKSISSLAKISLCWVFGYAGMWICKWVFGTALTGVNLFYDGVSQLILRSGNTRADGSRFGVFETVVNNVKQFLNTPFTALLLVFLLVTFVMACRVVKAYSLDLKKLAEYAAVFVLLGVAPVIWYALILNHSAIHYYFLSYKALAVSAMAATCLLAEICKSKRNNTPLALDK